MSYVEAVWVAERLLGNAGLRLAASYDIVDIFSLITPIGHAEGLYEKGRLMLLLLIPVWWTVSLYDFYGASNEGAARTPPTGSYQNPLPISKTK